MTIAPSYIGKCLKIRGGVVDKTFKQMLQIIVVALSLQFVLKIPEFINQNKYSLPVKIEAIEKDPQEEFIESTRNLKSNSQSKEKAEDDNTFTPNLRTSLDPKAYDFENHFMDILIMDQTTQYIKNYYVDNEKASYQHLLNSILTNLQEQFKIKIKRVEEDSDTEVYLNFKTIEYAIHVPENIDHTTWLHLLFQLCFILEKEKNFVAKFYKNNHYIDNPNSISVLLMNLMLNSLDDFSLVLTQDNYKDLKESTEGSFGGVGVLVGVKNDLLTVLKSIPNSPASRRGIHSLDKIISIDGYNTFGMDINELVYKMKGKEGTSINLGLLHDGDFSPTSLKLNREKIDMKSVTSYLIPYDPLHKPILYVAIDTFTNKTETELKAILYAHPNHRDFEGIIIDLRSNPGGLLDQAVKVADFFLKSGVIVSTKGKFEEVDMATFAKNDIEDPLVVLLNSEAASASEILAGALKDYNRALLLGVTSYGKGSVQTLFDLPEGLALKLTIARYYTPSGISIHDKGIEPDVWFQGLKPEAENFNLLADTGDRISHKKIMRHMPALFNKEKNYYLSAENTSIIRKSEIDSPEINLAVLCLRAALEQKSQDPQKAASKNVLDLYSNDAVKKFLDKNNNDVKQYLKNKLLIPWNVAPLMARDKDANNPLTNVVLKSASKISFQQGDLIKIEYSAENLSSNSLEEMSIFLDAREVGHDIFIEKLIGSMSPHSTKNGTIEFYIPSAVLPSNYNLFLGLLHDGNYETRLTKVIDLELKTKTFMNVLTQLDILSQDNTKDSTQTLNLKVINPSSSALHLHKIGIRNLSGEQVKLLPFSYTELEIMPNSYKILPLKIHSSQKMVSEYINFGVSIDSRDLQKPYRKIHSILAKNLIHKERTTP